MALKVKAQEKLQKIGTHAGKYRYIMMPELYTSLSQDKVIKEAMLQARLSRRGPLRATPLRCQDWAPCDSDCALRALRRLTRLRQASSPAAE